MKCDKTHLLIANRLRLTYVSSRDMDSLLARTSEIGRMLNGLVRRWKTRDIRYRKPDT